MQPVIAVEQLTKTYREGWLRRRSLEVLKGITLQVGQGEVFGLLGPNGAGKTTFIKILLGIVRPTGGQALLLGHPAGSRRGRRQVGYLPENLRIARHHSAVSALEYYGQLSGLTLAQIRQRSGHLLNLVGLSARANDSVAKYSKGMLQRLGLAQTLLHDPQLVVLDEPTDGLDPVGRSHVRNVLQQLKQEGKTVFLNSHILQEVELVCDRVAILDRGHMRYVGPVAEITTQDSSGEGALAVASTAEFEVQIELAGDESTAQSVLAPYRPSPLEPIPGGGWRVRLRMRDQHAVDQCVDELRRRGVSLLSLARRRVSLEDAFLRIVETEEAADAQVIE